MPQKTQVNPWDVVSTAPAPGSDWDVVSTDVDPNSPPPVNPSVPVPAALQGAPDAPPAKFGSSVGNILSTVAQRAKNLVASPYHAFVDAPQNAEEQQWKGTNPQSGPVANALGQFGLGAARMFVEPTIVNARLAKAQYDAGNNEGAFQSGMDAVPIVGPWARQIETDTQNKGAVAGLAGLGFDAFAPKVVAGTAGLGLRGLGTAMQAASATPESLRLFGTRALTAGSPGELLQSALKPNVRYGAGVTQTLQDSLPQVLEADPNLKGVSGFAQAVTSARDTQFGKYDNLISPYRSLPQGVEGPVRPGGIHGGPIAQAQMMSIPPMDLIENNATSGPMRLFDVPDPEGGTLRMGAPQEARGGIIQRTSQVADKYNRPISVPLADAIREDANAKLNAFYNKTGGDQAAALSNPETARVKAVGDTTRQLLYPQLESDAGLAPGTVSQMQTTYGKLADTADIANKREPIFARHDPVTLSQKIAVGHGGPVATAFNFVKEKALSKLTNSDALVNSAIDRFQNPQGTPLTPRPSLFAVGANGVGGAIRSTAPYLSGNVSKAMARLLFAPKGNTYGR
jgi:hypothetical protein